MRRLVFVRARINGTETEFLQPVAYNQGQAEPRLSYVPGDGLNKVQYMYSPENEIEFLVDPGKSAAFIREVKAADRDDSAPLKLITESGASVDAVPWGVDEGNPVVVHAQPDDGRW
jgi:hypothetical protein